MRKRFFIIVSLILSCVSLIYAQTPEWVTLPDMPRERYGHSSVIYQDHVWIIGGRTQLGSSISKIDCYNLNTREWEPDVSELQNARSNTAAAVYHDKIFVIGGHDDRQILNSVEYYDQNENKWKEVARMRLYLRIPCS
jgi:N-acetylneuraminic acid mutarotase